MEIVKARNALSYSRNLATWNVNTDLRASCLYIGSVCVSYHEVMQAEILRSIALMRTFIWQLTIIHLQSAMRQSCSNQILVFAHYLRIHCWRLCYRLNMHPSSTFSCHTCENAHRISTRRDAGVRNM